MTWQILPVALRVKRGGWPPIWLPLVLLWPILFLVFCLALPLCAALPSRRGGTFETVAATYHLMCALHGTELVLISSANDSWAFSLF